MANSGQAPTIKGFFAAKRYPEAYIQECFGVWTLSGKPSMEVLETLIESCQETGNKPNSQTLGRWRDTYNWMQDADVVEYKANELFQDQLAEIRAEMMMRHAEKAQTLQEKAIEFLENNEFENTTVALKAWQIGVEIERQSRGISGGIVNVFNMNDKQVLSELEEMISRLTPEDATVVDAGEDGIQDQTTS